MMVPNSLLDAFDWMTNTSQGANIFQQKLGTATTCMQTEQQAYPSLPALSGSQLEQNALVFYSGNTRCTISQSSCPCSDVYQSLYWVPSSGGTSWTENTSSPGFTYVQTVENNIQPQ